MSDGARQCFWRTPVLLVARFGDETRRFSTPSFNEHLAFVANHYAAIPALQLLTFGQFVRARRHDSAVVPMQLHRRHITARTELKVNGAGVWNRFRKNRGGAGVNAQGRAEFQCCKDRRNVMDAHVPEAARTEIPPAAPFER